ncbi:MAG: sigma-70 RNA polymerase sigma factor region 4 domain-containing protein [Planctomycetota bacterium]|jgi:RNA polymerase sigma factor (sigma-70 family)
MKFQETSLGGRGRGFPRTTWGVISQLRKSSDEERRAALESLSRSYWKPVYWYVRSAWAKGNEDAKDLTQAFFTWLLQGDAIRRYEPRLGGFRRYLKLLLKGFLGHQDEAMKRLKRGGGKKILPLEGDTDLTDDLEADPLSSDPEKNFDRAWMIEVFNKALDRVRKKHGAAEPSVAFRVFEAYDLSPEGKRSTYAGLAERMGLGTKEVERHLVALREEMRSEILAELAQSVASESDLQEEWNALFGA